MNLEDWRRRFKLGKASSNRKATWKSVGRVNGVRNTGKKGEKKGRRDKKWDRTRGRE